MKIKILLRHDADDFKGEMIAAHNRTKVLIKNFPDVEVEVLVLREYYNVFYCKLRGVSKVEKRSSFEYEGITYKALWFNFSPVDNILVKLHKSPIAIFNKLDRYVRCLKDADIVIAHSAYAGYVALKAKKEYGIPYTVTWHGSDIHTMPFVNQFFRTLTCRVIKNADANCFVSKDLMKKSEKLISKADKYVLYNGVDRLRFKPMSKNEVEDVKKRLGINDDMVHVAFIGNLYHVKNVLALPAIYKMVSQKFSKSPIQYHFVGDGPLRDELETLCNAAGINYKMWGNQPVDMMPSIINCMSLVVLPSINEGLPLISVETLACGVPMVGSNVGGIAEAIGVDNVVDYGDRFAEKLATLIVSKLEHKEAVNVGEEFSWEKTGQIEESLIKRIVAKYSKKKGSGSNS